MFNFGDWKFEEFKPAPKTIGFIFWKKGCDSPIGGAINEEEAWQSFYFDETGNGIKIEGLFECLEESFEEVDKVYFLNKNYKENRVVDLNRYREEKQRNVELESKSV